jgi:hypothetical protein
VASGGPGDGVQVPGDRHGTRAAIRFLADELQAILTSGAGATRPRRGQMTSGARGEADSNRNRGRQETDRATKTDGGRINGEDRERTATRTGTGVWPGRAGGGHQRIGGQNENPKTGSDTMLGIDSLYSIGAKGHIYSTCTGVQICRKTP